MQAEIDDEEGGAINVWNVHACGFRIASKLCAGSGQDRAVGTHMRYQRISEMSHPHIDGARLKKSLNIMGAKKEK